MKMRTGFPMNSGGGGHATGRYWWAAAWLGAAVGIFFRAHRLGAESLWFDEGYTAWMVSHSPAEIVRLIRADTAPPLYYLLLHGWTVLFGRSEIALRSLSTLSSILTLFIAMRIARRMLRNPAAVAAVTWLMSLSYLQIWFAREARAYALMGLLGVTAFNCLLRHLAARHRRWLIPLPLLIAAAMYTHNMMAPYVLGLLLVWLVLPSEHSTRRRIGEISLVTGIAALLYLPWAILGLPAQMEMIRHSFWMDPLKAGDLPAAIAALTGVKYFWSWTGLLDRMHIHTADGVVPMSILGCLLAGSAFVSIFGQTGTRRREALGLLTAAIFPPVAVALCSVVWTPVFAEKMFLTSASMCPIFFLLPLGMPLPRAGLRMAWCGAAILLLLTGLTLFGYYREITKEDWRGIARIVSELPGDRRLIVFIANDGRLPFDYYYHYRTEDEATGVPSDFFDLDPPRTMRRVLGKRDLEALRARLASGKYDQIVLILAHEGWGDPDHLTRGLLRESWQLAGQSEIRDLAIEWYRRSPP
jgi:mannosyltransferase